jgi:hypothetical protein
MMAELKRKDEQLTTADLASRADNKNRPAAEKFEDRPSKDRPSKDRASKDRASEDRPNENLAANEEWGGPTLVRSENASQTKANEIREDVRPQEKAPASAARSAGSAPLFSEADVNDLRARWGNTQSTFVDEPRRAVEEADKLVATVMQRLADGFAKERSNLEKQWGKGDNVSTEDLRVALQRYRSFFDRLLAA